MQIVRGADLYTKVVLSVIAVFLGVIAFKPVVSPAKVEAQDDRSYLYIEPQTTVLRRPDGLAQVEGKVVVDRRTGDVWGFPTASSAPYPVNTSDNRPPVSKAMYLGKFDFTSMTLPSK
jgi:hypothetical protein